MEKKRFFIASFVPMLFLITMWSIFLLSSFFNVDIVKLGLYPLKSKGLIGIITSHFIHVEFNHIISNTVPLIVLGTLLFYFYPEVALKVLLILLIIPNIIVWFIGRPSYHIGSSGLIYGLVSYMFFCGVFTGNKSLLSISLLVIFLYGSIIWAIFPIDYKISWESHLAGFITGMVLSAIFKDKYVYKEKLPEWYTEDDEKYAYKDEIGENENDEYCRNN
ncbi:MAG: rhomboid family intramembrane serine protease [Bacteroidales bacterium]|nr:rhomboid family intramembrane serine protease [Bacteroidales bacterium]